MDRNLKNGFLLLFSLFFFSSLAQQKEQIEIIDAKELIGLTVEGKQAQKLRGNVKFRHQKALMYCDSALFYRNENLIDAYGHIRINQGDTLNLYGDVLHYDGNSRIAKVEGKVVKLENSDFTLKTNALLYNRLSNIAQYNTGGIIQSKNDSNVLVSKIGYFLANQSLFFFKDSVSLSNPDFVMRSDTLKYYSKNEMVNFLGPTTIEGDSNLIYCETGWYDTPKDISQYYENAYLISDGRKLEGDTLYYERNSGYGRAIGAIQITDTAEQVLVNGLFGEIFEKEDSAIVHGKALLTQIFDLDSLFMHADTFKVFTNDSNERSLLAYYGVKIYKQDLQGKCDSISYSLSDSTIELHGSPILWSEQNQLTAERIDIRTANSKIHSLFLETNAFIISEVDSLRFNQIKGKEMTGFFKSSKLNLIQVRGNGQTTYWGQDEEDKFIGVNVAESSDIDIKLADEAIQSISFINQPKATMHPMGELDPVTELRYRGFRWLINERPLSKEAVFD